MKRLLQTTIIICLGLLFIPGYLFSQVTTSAISGRAVDELGKLFPEVNVLAVHLPSGTEYGTSTREDGRYTLPNLRIGGPYKITATFVGYQAFEMDNVFLSLGETKKINIVLQPTALNLEEIEVTASTPETRFTTNGTDIELNREQLDRLPTISRSASDYYRVVLSSDGNSFLGRNDQFNNFSLDGSIFNNPFGLDAATPGGQTDAQPISLDAIDQIKVSMTTYDVTLAGFTGASINAVTKSGTNDFSGTVFGFFRNQDLAGSKIRGNEIFTPDLSQFQTGFSIGGPIIKDKLFFFVNAEIERREDLGSNFIAAGSGRSGENVSRVEVADLELVSQTLMNAFNYQTGPYENYFHQTENEKGIIKLDWNINKQHSLTATYNFLNAFKEKPAHPSALGRRGPDFTTLQFFNSGYRINNIIHSGLLELKSNISNRFSNKFQAGFTAFRDSRDPFSSPFPVININENGIRYIIAGHEPFSINNVLDQNVYQLTNNFSIYAGAHSITIGGSMEAFTFDNSFNLNAYGGTFGAGFESVTAFVQEVQSGEFDDDVAFARRPISADEWALAETNVGQLSFYAQDKWKLTNNFQLTYGLRIDVPLYFNTEEKIQDVIDRNDAFVPGIEYVDEDGETIVFEHTQLPDQDPFISPRLGFEWDIKDDQKSILRGGSGLFTGRFPFVWIGNQVANPNFFFYNVTRTDFRFPQVWRTNLEYDQYIWRGWRAAVNVIYTKDINAMMVRNYGLRPPSGTLQGVDNRVVYTEADRVEPFANNAYVFTNTDIGQAISTSFQIRREWYDGYYFSIGYNFLDATDASSIEAEISSDAYERNPALGDVNQAIATSSLYGNRHRVVGSASKKWTYLAGTWATTVGMFFEYAQGGRFTYTYSGDINRDGSGLNDLIYIPTESELQSMDFEGTEVEKSAQRQAFNRFIQQDEYLSERRGQYAEKYAILSPWFSTWDIRILQDFNFKVGDRTNTIQFSIDILNFGNLLNSDWGIRQFPTSTQPVGLVVDPGTNFIIPNAKGEPVFTFDDSLQSTFTDDFSLRSRWQLQFGLRYIF